MEDTFDIPVTYNGEDHLFKSVLLVLGYTHKIQVDVNGVKVLFEPDEERNYRAYIDPEQEENKAVDVVLLKAIAEVIEEILE